MTEGMSILLIGLDGASKTFASEHFRAGGHPIDTAPDLASAGKQTDISAQLIFLQSASEDRTIEDLDQASTLFPTTPVILICSRYDLDITLDVWRAGAADIVFLPLTAEALNGAVERAEQRVRNLAAASEPQARIHYLDETGKERWVTVTAPKFTVGRSSTNDLVLPQVNISRSQAEIFMRDGGYVLRDLESKHGTFLNGIRIEEAPLTHGARLQLGGLRGQTITFHQGDLLQSLLGSESKPDVSLAVRGFKEMGMLLSTLRALSSIPLLDDLLSLVVDAAIELTGAERGFIMLNDDAGELLFRCARNAFKAPLDGSSFQTSRRVPEDVYATGKRKVINDLDIDTHAADHSTTRRLGVRSISCVPLRYLTAHDSGSVSSIGRMETIGVLYVDSQNIGTGLSTTQIDALDTLASEAAMAIYNARLYKESQEKRKLDEQLAIAQEIQQALLPSPDKDLPFVCARSRNLPCHEVGGDYFDYFDMEEGRFGFALGDVAGKGMPAALLTSVLQGIFSAQTLLNLPLPVMISNVNRNLASRGTGNRFVTFFFGILDSEGNCTYTNAGHNPPLLVSKDGSLKELTEGGLVLGLFPTATYESGSVRLQAGDHLVLFTDGVMEARDAKGEEFGDDRLQLLLKENAKATAVEILQRLNEAITEFSANTPQHDDITMMILGFQES